MEEINFGAITSPADYRDEIVASGVLGEVSDIQLPVQFHTDLEKVLMQAKTPACVSHSIVELMRLYWFRKTGKWIDLSPRFLDILSDETWIPLDGGRVPRTVLKLAVTIGCCTTMLLPNDTNLPISEYRDPKVITKAMMDEAVKYRIPGYYAVKKDKTSTRTSIYLHGAISSLMQIGEEWWVPSWLEKDVSPLRTPKSVVSGHQITPNGWVDDSKNTLRNHWSDGWGRKGEADFNHEDWRPFTPEQWAIAEIPSNVKDFLKNLPSPSEFHLKLDKDLKLGDVSEDVKFLQVAYMILGHMAPVSPDQLGIFGPKTMAANEKFQRSQRIAPVPANVGPQTRSALNKLFAI